MSRDPERKGATVGGDKGPIPRRYTRTYDGHARRDVPPKDER